LSRGNRLTAFAISFRGELLWSSREVLIWIDSNAGSCRVGSAGGESQNREILEEAHVGTLLNEFDV
tara:strand:- start:197 stop:394 length:198 start_codon:yes stop_codon:yes gene_type:complete